MAGAMTRTGVMVLLLPTAHADANEEWARDGRANTEHTRVAVAPGRDQLLAERESRDHPLCVRVCADRGRGRRCADATSRPATPALRGVLSIRLRSADPPRSLSESRSQMSLVHLVFMVSGDSAAGPFDSRDSLPALLYRIERPSRECELFSNHH